MPELLGAVVLGTVLLGLVVKDLLVLHGVIVRTLEASEHEGERELETAVPIEMG
jgi:hypothetical protein